MAFTIKQNDTSPSLEATLSDANLVPVNLTAATVMLHMKAIGGDLILDEQMTLTDAENGVVQYDWRAGDTATVGTYYVEFEVTYLDGSVETFPNTGNAVVVITSSLN